MPTMPNGLEPVVQNYSFGEAGGVQRTEVGGGSPRSALLWDRGVQPFRVTMVLKAVQFSVWTAFYTHVIKKGALAFDMPLNSGFGTITHRATIIPGSYNAAPAGSAAVWTVDFMVEAESSAYAMTAADGAAFVDVYNAAGPDLDALFARIAQFANVDTLVLP